MPQLGRACTLLWLTVNVALGAIHFQRPADLPEVEYDFGIIGGGTAGATVASRLGEDPHLKILVIEAGPSNEDIFESHIPGLAFSLAGTRVDWNYTAVPQPEINSGVAIPYSRARMLGGVRLTASVTRNKELSWDNVYSDILKTEKWTSGSEHQDERGHFDPSLHSRTGKASVSAPYPVHPLNDALFNATRELSDEFPFKLDMNDGRPIGFGWAQSTIGKGVRSSSATGYLASTGTNIHVLINTLVTRITPVDRANTDFRGVEFAPSTGGIRKQLTAKREVILSGGVINTPQVLLNSGIGSKAELDPLGIRTLVDNPSVGKNLTDQTAVIVSFATNFPVTTFDPTAALLEWNKSHTGLLSRAPFMNLIGWVRFPENAQPFKDGFADPSAGKNSPHIELIFGGIASRTDATPASVTPVTSGPSNSSALLQMYVVNLNPTSRGSVSFTTSNPFSHPKIDFQFYKEPVDIAILREGIRSADRLFSASAWESKVLNRVTPPSDATTDAELDAFVKGQLLTMAHGIGTAGMSPKGAKWGVVDPDFIVKGTKGLRVVDASVMPYVTCGHTQTPVYAIAERASDVIKRAWD